MPWETLAFVDKVVNDGSGQRLASAHVQTMDGKVKLTVAEVPMDECTLQYGESEIAEMLLNKKERRELIKALSKGL